MKKALTIINPRVMSGIYKGSKLEVPKSARPTTDRVKKTIFDILGSAIQDTRVLDLFAGSGNLGIEALSNGAKEVTLVEVNTEAIAVIKKNLTKLHIESNATVIQTDYRKLNSDLNTFGIIFIDPPFTLLDHFNPTEIIDFLSNKGIIIFKTKTSINEPSFSPLTILDKRVIGINTLYFLAK